MYDSNHLTSIGIKLASPDVIKGWSKGEVKKPETINYRTQKPEADGLFCEKIFGPVKSWECHCGKYKKIRYKGMVCDKCGVEVTKNSVRRERMGHIELAVPVSHIWYFRGIPSRMSLVLDIAPKTLEKILYFQSYVVIDEGKSVLGLREGDIISEERYNELKSEFGEQAFLCLKNKYFKVTDTGVLSSILSCDQLLAFDEIEALEKEFNDGSFSYEPTDYYLVNDPGEATKTGLKKGQIIDEKEVRRLIKKYPSTMLLDRLVDEAIANEKAGGAEIDDKFISETRYKIKNSLLRKYHVDKLWSVEVTTDSYFTVVNPGELIMGELNLRKGDVIDEPTYKNIIKPAIGDSGFAAGMGADTIKSFLEDIDLNEISAKLSRERDGATGQKRAKLIKRLEVIEAFKHIDNNGIYVNLPEWMVLSVLPVLPAELRPMVTLDGGRYATSDLNDLYRRVINRNNRLKKLYEVNAPEIILRNEQRMLQEAVDSLIDNGRRGRPVTGSTSATANRQLKSLTDMLKGKQGRFRQNLLGKRVDYSGRSVIVVGPELKMHQCGLPKEMALELFKPFVIKKLCDMQIAPNIKVGRRIVDNASDSRVWDILEDIIKDHPVMLNRAPTLHRLGIQAFEPILVEGRAIKLHPLVCTAFNADFDGDQMAVHVPLSAEAQAEARFLMLSCNNLLKPQDGKPITVPTQDMILGCYYLTMMRDDSMTKKSCKGDGMVFSSLDEAFLAYESHEIELQSKISVRVERDINGETKAKTISSTFGRFIFNTIIEQNLGYVDRTVPGQELDLEVDFQVGKKQLGDIIDKYIHVNGSDKTVVFLDNVKAMGYKYSTLSGISIGIEDMIVPDVKKQMLEDADAQVERTNFFYERGKLSEEGRHKHVVDIWQKTTDDLTDALKKNLKADNPIKMMSSSGARGNDNQIKQLAGMRGNMADTSGNTIEIPIKSNLREGMNVLEFFISSHGARKALSDTAIKTADSGYLTRRLVDVAQEVIISEEDCGCLSDPNNFTWISAIVNIANDKQDVIKSISDRLDGRYTAEEIKDRNTGEVIIGKNELITSAIAKKIEKAGIAYDEKADGTLKERTKKFKIRSVFDCQSPRGICSRCYGTNLANGLPIVAGEAVGVIAAQSIGEPGTQLTMRTFHTGGIANSGEDITQGLPRVEELFEARKPKGEAIMSEVTGVAHVEEGAKGIKEIVVTPDTPVYDENGKERSFRYKMMMNATTRFIDGDVVEVADQLTDGAINPNDIMKIKDERAVEKYIVSEVIKVYKNGGVSINDKHIEVITRQMLRRIKIEDPGDTDFITGQNADMLEFETANRKCLENGLRPASGKRQLMGITKASSSTHSFLSAASFQETAKNLTDAAVKGKTDYLMGLKENVIIGSIIPAGTGYSKYRDIIPVPAIKSNYEVITGNKYNEDNEDTSKFDNEYYKEVEILEDVEDVAVDFRS